MLFNNHQQLPEKSPAERRVEYTLKALDDIIQQHIRSFSCVYDDIWNGYDCTPDEYVELLGSHGPAYAKLYKELKKHAEFLIELSGSAANFPPRRDMLLSADEKSIYLGPPADGCDERNNPIK